MVATTVILGTSVFSPLYVCPCHRLASSKFFALCHAPAPARHRFRLSLLRSHRYDASVVSSSSSFQMDSREDTMETGELEKATKIELGKHWDGGNLRKRVLFGLITGIGAGGVVMAGEWIFTVAVSAAVFLAAREYFRLVRCQGIAASMTPPPRYLSRVCSVICALMPLLTAYFGHMDVSVTLSAFFVAVSLICQRTIPRFSQLSSTVFGLFYCGYLPCFWIKLRCGLTSPVFHAGLGTHWPIFLSGSAHGTVGLVATIISVSSIIAADTFAFLGGRAFGRTYFTSISPKKTLEGAFIGLVGCIAVAVALSRILSWPSSLLSAAAFGVLNFVSSLFGDLTESLIKRDAGVKDSGSLIPGHGGILDRLDSYLFTGALCYPFVKFAVPAFGT